MLSIIAAVSGDCLYPREDRAKNQLLNSFLLILPFVILVNPTDGLTSQISYWSERLGFSHNLILLITYTILGSMKRAYSRKN